MLGYKAKIHAAGKACGWPAKHYAWCKQNYVLCKLWHSPGITVDHSDMDLACSPKAE